MPDTLVCPRCGTVATDATKTHLLAWAPKIAEFPKTAVYRCPCGPLCVVEGESVTWYVLMEVESDE